MLSVSDEVFCGGIPASHSGNKIKDSIFKTLVSVGFFFFPGSEVMALLLIYSLCDVRF